jgi:hypothetical protein
MDLQPAQSTDVHVYPRMTIHGSVHAKVHVDWATVFKFYQMFTVSGSRASMLSPFLQKETQYVVKLLKLSYDSGTFNEICFKYP